MTKQITSSKEAKIVGQNDDRVWFSFLDKTDGHTFELLALNNYGQTIESNEINTVEASSESRTYPRLAGGNQPSPIIESSKDYPISIVDTAYSDNWQKAAAKPDLIPEFRQLYDQDYYVITGNSEGSKTYEFLGMSLENRQGNLLYADQEINLLALYSRITKIKRVGEDIYITVEPRSNHAGYDWVSLSVNGFDLSKTYNFIFVDSGNRELSKIKHSV